jgi:hypothetical protein
MIIVPEPLPHAFVPVYTGKGPCYTCNRIRPHRTHQPLWWRVLHPRAEWR